MIYIQITMGVALYLAMCLVLARFCGINNMRHNRLRWPAYPKQERRQGTDRRRRQAAIICNYRQAERRRPQLLGQSGAVVIVVAIVLGTICLPFMALAIDYGMAFVDKTKAQAVADSCALGASSALYHYNEPRPTFCDYTTAPAVGEELADKNGLSAGQCSTEVGHWSGALFTPGALGNIPDWETVTLIELYQDTFFTNAARCICTLAKAGPISGVNYSATATAIAMRRMAEAPEGETGVIIKPGSALVK